MTSKIKVNNIEDASGNAMVSKCGTTVTLGKTGDTIQLASGASQTGFGRTGTVDWDTTAKTASFTAVSGNGYFVNTTSAAITVTLPASPSAGDIVAVADYAGTSATNNITIARNGSNIEGDTSDASLDVARESKTFVYVDTTQGWLVVNSNDESTVPSPFLVATGGTETTCGDYKIHTFTGPGTFCISSIGSVSANNKLDYLVVAGGGAGGPCVGGGGGAGGTRFSDGTATGCYTAGPSPLGATALTATVNCFPITVGAGTAGIPASPTCVTIAPGSNSIFSTITSTGGGGGGGASGTQQPIQTTANGTVGGNGGSGGGGGFRSGSSGGSGNTPPVSPAQGTNGGTATPSTTPTTIDAGGGGGGATAAGSNASNCTGGNGGTGLTSSITGSPVGYGGGGGGSACAPGGTKGTGSQGGGTGGKGGDTAGTSGTANTGGGGGGAIGGGVSGSGGSGIVIIRYKYQ